MQDHAPRDRLATHEVTNQPPAPRIATSWPTTFPCRKPCSARHRTGSPDA
ncbi:hypothetical protein ACFPTY_19700 [Halomonas beimenensis]